MAYMLETVARITGASIKQLIHWDACGLVKPSVAQASGKGSRRVYSFLDVLSIKTAVTLRREGITLQKIRRCLKFLQEHKPEVTQPLASLNLVTDGAAVFLLSDNPGQACQDRLIVNTLAGGQLLFVVPVGRIACEAQSDIARLLPDVPHDFPLTTSLDEERGRRQRRVRATRRGRRAG